MKEFIFTYTFILEIIIFYTAITYGEPRYSEILQINMFYNKFTLISLEKNPMDSNLVNMIKKFVRQENFYRALVIRIKLS